MNIRSMDMHQSMANPEFDADARGTHSLSLLWQIEKTREVKYQA